MTNKPKRERMKPPERKEKLLDIAVELAAEIGCSNITRTAVAIHAQCAQGLVTHYFKSVAKLKQLILDTAIEREIMPILVEALIDKQITLSPELKQKVLSYLTH